MATLGLRNSRTPAQAAAPLVLQVRPQCTGGPGSPLLKTLCRTWPAWFTAMPPGNGVNECVPWGWKKALEREGVGQSLGVEMRGRGNTWASCSLGATTSKNKQLLSSVDPSTVAIGLLYQGATSSWGDEREFEGEAPCPALDISAQTHREEGENVCYISISAHPWGRTEGQLYFLGISLQPH